MDTTVSNHETKHTPGPWRSECADDEDRFDDWSLDVVPGAVIYGKIIEGDDVAAIVLAETDAGYERRKALILAAPELLASLKRMLFTPGNGITPEEHRDALAAIAKAEGR